ncbi:CARDB domain-containing protein [Chloroflexota bacterium]
MIVTLTRTYRFLTLLMPVAVIALSAVACAPGSESRVMTPLPMLAGETVLMLNNDGNSTLAANGVAPDQPDLIVENISWLPASPRLGDKVTFTITVRNQGAGQAGASSVTCYLDDEYLASLAIDPLKPNTAATAEINWTSQAGSHVIKAEADSGQSIPENDETNNGKTFAFSVLAPDLIIASINASPEHPYAGDKVTFTVTIKNEGSSSARFSHVYFYIDGASQGSRDVLVMDAGDVVTKSFSWIAKSGVHTVTAVADALNQVVESDEANNTGILNYATTTPDLIVNTITWSPSDPVAGDNITITLSVKNQGEGKASSSHLAYYIDDGYVASAYIKPLNPGASASASFSWETQTGSHTVKAVADAREVVAESDESNNTKTATLPSLSPDLVVQNITWSPSSPLIAHRVTFTITVANRGRSDASQTRLHLCIERKIYYYSVGELAAGATANQTFGWVTLQGTHTIEAIADAENSIIESDESNNSRTATFTAATSAPSDLVVQGIKWVPEKPVVGEEVTLTVTLRNQGSGSSAWSNLAYYLDDNYLTTALISPVNPNATTILDLYWQAQAGSHTFRVVADSEQRLMEESESNNTKTTTLSVLAPDLIVKDIAWTPVDPAVGETVTFTATMLNQGDHQAEPSYLGYFVDGSPRGQHYVDGLAPGATVTKTFTWTAQEGVHNITFAADTRKEIAELAENNNEKSVTIPTPDLILTGIAWSTENSTRVEEAVFTVTINNDGAGKAGPSSVYFYLDGSYIGYVHVPEIAAGGTAAAIFTSTIPTGPHDIRAVVDGENILTETDETNNEQTVAFPVSPHDATTPEVPDDTPAAQAPTVNPEKPPATAPPSESDKTIAKPEDAPFPIDAVTSKTLKALPYPLLETLNGILERWWPALAAVFLGGGVILFLLRLRSRQKLQNQT